ncbi:electron transport complex subunit RsxG [Planctobacterium marinum]|uniref:Ion-translocating oxidoreductase complex subunit G n=1 Tax=Planctobacterium marinum TaxID=1631968 RepID=A0AA48HT34_9ALTE|nr:electron transport complex subunit G [Planctobacterium marinum]
MIKGISRNGAILGGFTLATTMLIAITHWVTSPVIAKQVQSKALQTITEVFPANYWDNAIAQNCTVLNSPAGDEYKIYRSFLNQQPSGLVIEAVTKQGYGGNIKYLVSVIDNSKIGGVRVLEHKETPGLGDKIELRISDWIHAFDNQATAAVSRPDWAVKKDGGRFDQFTGATITPRALVNGVKDTVTFVQENYQAIFDLPNQCNAAKDTAND